MQFMLMFYETAPELARRDGPDAPAYWGAWSAYVQAIRESGVVRNGDGLQPPPTATTLRLANGKRLIQDGPFADTKEQLGGYFVIDVANLDQALDWAARAPCAGAGGVEVRPVLPPPTSPQP